MIIDEENYLAHYGILRRSGRYPWGSGGNVEQRSRTFIGMIHELRKQGLSDAEIARGFSTPDHKFTTTDLRAANSIARNAVKQADISRAQDLHDRGNSNVAIGKEMGIPESTVRALLAPGERAKADRVASIGNMLKEEVASKGWIDVGLGVERYVGVARNRLDVALARLKEEGYALHNVQIPQLGTGKKTMTKVLAPPGTTYREINQDKGRIKLIGVYSEDRGETFGGFLPPLDVSSKRVAVRYVEEGGGEADGVIYVRPGVHDLSLGKSRYAQVRISVDGTHYLKGMAMYKDDLPNGVDLLFNTNKSNTGNKLDAMKKIKKDADGNMDPDLPFGAVVRQLKSPDGRHVTSAMNIVNEEGDWGTWSKTLSSQFLSKQKPSLAKTQLDMTFERRRTELDGILALTNPVVKRRLLEQFADSVDSAAVHLKAAALPRQGSHVILPINSLKENEIYAPNYHNGERVVLVRHPHGGTFELPELTVNNRNREAIRLFGKGTGMPAPDAVGINSKVAQRLSGADFDGDTVIVIPNNKGLVKTSPALEQLKDFDPQLRYPAYDGMRTMSGGTYNAKTHSVDFAEGEKATGRTKGTQMGLVSNLITDMTIQGASHSELARAVRHSMVVIDAEKHNLDWKRSAIDHGIANLMEKYQKTRTGGASTLISNSGVNAIKRIPERKARSAAAGGAVDRATGKRVFEPTGATYVDKKTGKVVTKLVKVPKLSLVDDAHTLVSTPGTQVERIYADHSNKLKAMANEARKAMVETKTTPYSPSAKAAYAKEVASLNSKLNIALKNAPIERHAQALAGAVVAQKKRANPDMEAEEEKKIRNQALNEMRIRTGAHKTRINITDSEWAAIQAGAVSSSRLDEILRNADQDQVKQLATPKQVLLMTTTKKQRAIQMLSSGFTQAEVAEQLGVSLTTLKNSLSE